MFVLGSSSTCMINFGVLVKTALLGLPCFAGIQALVDIADKISSCIIFQLHMIPDYVSIVYRVTH